jgi:hypothetical protein
VLACPPPAARLVRTWRRWKLVRKPDNPETYARKVLVDQHRSLLRRALVENPACAPIPVGDTVQDRAFLLIDGMHQTVMPAEVRAALYRALAKIPGVTVVQGATDAAGRRGVALARAAAIEGPGSSGWLRLEIILDSDTDRYLGARHVVARDHSIAGLGGPRGTWFRKGQVLVSRAQLALAVVNAPASGPARPPPAPPMSKLPWWVDRDVS